MIRRLGLAMVVVTVLLILIGEIQMREEAEADGMRDVHRVYGGIEP